jgi:type II secretory pathway pseudopilin PulG
VNDPPIFVSIDEPIEGAYSPILYNIYYSAGSSVDPDTLYNDTIEYQWDFDASDGWQVDRVGETGYWNFPRAGNYTVTLRAVDSSGAYVSNTTYIVVDGVRDENDYDNDGLLNEWEDTFGFNKYDPSDATIDSDGDGMSNIAEFTASTDPKKRDTDSDGVPDGEDYAPLDKGVWEEPKPEEKWTDDPLNILLLVAIVLVVVLLLIGLIVFLLVRSRKRSKEEEERRKLAEQMQKSVYEGQDLYGNLPAMEQTPQMAAGPQQPALPPPPETGSLDDVFGGAGTLPGLQQPPAPGAQGLPPAPQPIAPPQAAPPIGQPQAAKPADITDLLG